jgi:hypothetical protein
MLCFFIECCQSLYFIKVSKIDAYSLNCASRSHEKVFYDSMKFWNDKEGMLWEIHNRLSSIIVTRDDGIHGTKFN